MTATVVLDAALADEIRHVAEEFNETAGILLSSVVRAPNGDIRLLAREMVWLEKSAYDKRGPFGLLLNSEGYTRPLATAETLGAVPIWVHTHPGQNASPRPSTHDELVDAKIADVFRLRSGSAYYGALIFSRVGADLAFTGHLDFDGQEVAFEHLWIVGDRFQLIRAYGNDRIVESDIFDRNIRAFGGAVQDALGQLHVGIVGNGGTGSAIAEQLVRLGVRNFTLVDPDVLSESNVTRVYGSTHADIGRAKVEVLADHLIRVAPDAKCARLRSTVNVEGTAKHLAACDLIFGCTDDNAGRLVLSRIATYLLTPVIDCGVLLSSDENGRLVGVDGRVTSVFPGTACLVCRNRIDLARASAELLTPSERIRREDEGYAPALGQREPAVVAFTTMVAATVVSELLERLIGYGPEPRPTEVLVRCHEREISTNIAAPRKGHYCDPAAGKMGLGMSEPYLGLTWGS
jgi:molybdopterin/thiamine biosynthesis adenylyltransferase